MMNSPGQPGAVSVPVGVQPDAGIGHFVVWAPSRRRVELLLTEPTERTASLQREEGGYWSATVPDVTAGDRYLFRLDGELERPDPASRFQPDGVHRASMVIDHTQYKWQHANWRGMELRDMIMYELHVGTFTPEGTFAAAISRLAELADLGVTAVELMPVAQFPGNRNWGYDGAYPFAVQNSYGGPDGLKHLVDAAHGFNMAIILDVVYNHLGPEGNYLSDYGPYFTDRYRTPWGRAINFDGAHSDAVRNYFIENALSWFRDYRVDALRLDAVHGIFDQSARPFLRELAERAEFFSSSAGRKHWLIAESDLNDTRLIRTRAQGGYGLAAQWCDDFHHCLHTLVTGEASGYYADFGAVEQMATAIRDGFVYSGQYSPHRQRRHGSPSHDCPAEQFVVFSQNHDQVGNRMKGERLAALVSFEALKLAAGAVLLSPYNPLLWMGEEYAEVAPFLYFVSHGDAALIEAVQQGRREEFAAFGWKEEAPDPQSVTTFEQSRLDWSRRRDGRGAVLLDFYRRLIELRRSAGALNVPTKKGLTVSCDHSARTVVCRRECDDDAVMYIMCFSNEAVTMTTDFAQGNWRRLLDSADEQWQGPGSTSPRQAAGRTSLARRPWSLVVYRREQDR